MLRRRRWPKELWLLIQMAFLHLKVQVYKKQGFVWAFGRRVAEFDEMSKSMIVKEDALKQIDDKLPEAMIHEQARSFRF